MHKGLTKDKNTAWNIIGLRQNKKAFGKGAIAITLILAVAFSGCIGNASTSPNAAEDCADSTACSLSPAEQTDTPKEASTVEKIEVYHFHGTNQCYSCKTVGAYAEETLNTFFADELESGKIVFGHINGDLPENQELVKKYEVASASFKVTAATEGPVIRKSAIFVMS